MRVRVNGEYLDTNVDSIWKLRDECGYPSENTVVIKNGYQTSEDVELTEGDIVSFIKKGVMPDEKQLAELMRARHTPGVYDAVKDARVVIAGLGGLGSNIAIMLARMGVGHLHLIDFDTVDASNLNRQQYYIRHLGMYKTDAMKELLGEINPFIEVATDCVKITEENVLSLVENADVVCEAFDNPAAKAMLTEAVLTRTDKVLVAGSGMAGIDSSNTIKTKKVMNRFYMCGDGVTGAGDGIGLMAPRVTVCAAHEANMIIRIICGMKNV